MFRVGLGLGLALLTGVAAAGSAAANDGRTTRIEPRGFYGATVSIESGVRVFRPLPRSTHVIINPNKTPLALSVEESKHTYSGRAHNKNPSPHNNAYAPSRGHAPSHYGSAGGGLPIGLKKRGQRRLGAVRRVGGDRVR